MTITIEVTTRGLKLEEVAEHIKAKLIPEVFERFADLTYEAVMEEVPRRTGTLARSIVKEVTEGGYAWQIRALAPYDVYVQQGTAPHEIRPVRASMLVFRADRRLVFTPLVHHPGTKPNPYMQRAVDKTKAAAPWVVAEALEEIFKEY